MTNEKKKNNWNCTIGILAFDRSSMFFAVAWDGDRLAQGYSKRKIEGEETKTLSQTNDRIYVMLLALPVDRLCVRALVFTPFIEKWMKWNKAKAASVDTGWVRK